jgi:phage-related minor tail protein
VASKNIRGITIEIGGDTTKLGKAIEDSEKKSRSLQVELREIEKALKFDPTNIELLSQKQTVLTQNIEETSKKLDTLKEAEKQVIAQFEKGEVAEEQVRALQREIIQTEGVLGSMKSELTSTEKAMKDLADGTDSAEKHTKEYKESVEKAKKELEEFKNQASDAFDVLGKGVLALGAGATATAGYALKLSTEFDKAFNTLQTQTGATAEEMVELNESMERIYANNFGESMEDVAISMATVKTQTKLTGKELEKITTNAILMRDTFGFEVNESIRAVNSLMNQFGITADEAYNLIAQGAQNGLNQNDDLLDTINEYSVQFKGAGYDAEDMFNMLVNGANEGTWSIDKLGDAVKEYNIRMSDGTALEYLTQLGLNAEEVTKKFGEGGSSAQEATNTIIEALKGVENEQDRYIIGQGIMGTMWEDLGEEAVYALLDTQGEISATSDALENINAIKYDDIGSALAGLKRTLETEVIDPLGDELKPVVEDTISYVQDNAPAIKEVLSNIVSVVGDFVKLVVDNADVIVSTIVAIGAGFVAWNVATMIQGVVGAIKAFQLATQGATIAQWALNVAVNANPIGIIITLIAGLVAGLIALWNTSDEFRAFWINLWETVKNAVSVAVEAVVTWFSEAWTQIVSVWSVAVEWFGEIASAISGFFSSAWDAIVAVWSNVVTWFSGVWSGIVAVFSPAITWFSALFTSIYNTLSSIVAVIVELLKGCWLIITTVFGIAYDWFNNTVITPVSNAFSALWNTISTLASSAWTTISSIFSAVAGWFNSTVITPISNFFSNMWTKLKSGASGAWTGVKNVFSNVTTWFRDKFTEAWTAVKNVFSTGGKIFTGITEGITSTFKTVVNGIIGGINDVVAVPFNAINGVLNTIRSVNIAGIAPFSGLPTISVPQIPLLYQGGILKKGQVGLLEGNGSEAVVPLEKETGWINRIAQKMNELQDVNQNNNVVALSAKLDEMIQTMKALKSTIVLDTGVLVGETINQIDEQLGNNYTLRARGI